MYEKKSLIENQNTKRKPKKSFLPPHSKHVTAPLDSIGTGLLSSHHSRKVSSNRTFLAFFSALHYSFKTFVHFCQFLCTNSLIYKYILQDEPEDIWKRFTD